MKKIAIANAKGGVGKTFLSTNLAVALANSGLKTLLVDSNCDLPSMLHWQRDEAAVENLTVARCSEDWGALSGSADYTLIDTGPSTDAETLQTLSESEILLLVTTPEPESIHGLIKTLEAVLLAGAKPPLFVVTNQTLGPTAARRLGSSVERKLSRLLSVSIASVADVPYDPAVADLAIRRQPIVSTKPKHRVSSAVERIARSLRAFEPARAELDLLPQLKVNPAMQLDKAA